MERYTIQDGATTYTRISKSDARKMFNTANCHETGTYAAFYRMSERKRHEHSFTVGQSGDVETCQCGKFRFTLQGLSKHPTITEQRA